VTISAIRFRLPAGAAISSFSGMEQTQLTQYLPVLMLFAVALACTAGMLALSALLGKRGGRNPAKDSAYECGIVPAGTGSTRFSVKFYLVAMLFILFDIEVVFLYPWAVVYRDMLSEAATRNLILFAMVSFLGILFVGYLYALKKRAFDWKS
jgi:NADH-quinone oxidoreductase subunit A